MEFFGQIMPMNSSGKEVCGYLNALNEEFYLVLRVEDEISPKKIHLRGCKKLESTLKPVLDTLKQHLLQSNSIKDMLSEIQNTLEKQVRIKGPNCALDSHMKYNILLEQLQICGWDKVQYISSDFQSVHLKASDEIDREHVLKLWIPEKFPNEPPRFEYDLPSEFNYKWLPDDTLLSIFNAFQENLARYCEFWNYMDELDTKTWVLEPENPMRKDCKRRIALTSGVSVLLIVNSTVPSSIPTCHYLGPERIIEPIREKFNRNIHLWSDYDSILTNLQQVLEIEFPSPAVSAKEEFCLECGICYSYQLDDAIPNIICEDSNCNKSFHHVCLYEYIRMLPDVRTSFNKLFGECPYCSNPLWCTIP